MFYFKESEEEQKPTKDRPSVKKIDISTWSVGRSTEKAVSTIKAAYLRKGGSKDTVMTVVIEGKDLELFTPHVENRLLALFRKMYRDIVLLDISTPAEAEQRRRELLLIKAQREHNKREKKHLKSLNSISNHTSDTLF